MKRIRKIFCVVLMSVSLIGCGRIQDSKLNSDVDNNVNITQKKEDSIYVEKDNLNESEIVNAETQDKSSKEQIKYNDENTFLYSEYILNQKK